MPSGEPTTFIARRLTSQESVLESFSALNGAPLGDITALPGPPGVSVSGPYRAGANNVWLTTTGGPEYTSNVAGGDPKPNSCNATVSVLDPITHLASVVLETPHSEFVFDAVPSADGQRYAYLVGNCTSYEKQHVVIANLANSSTVSIGLNTTRCHFITTPAWSSNGSQLTFSYSPPTLAKSTLTGACLMPLPGEVAIVPTSHSSVITTKELTKAPRGCSYAVSAFNSNGVVAIETCGALGKSSTYLTQMNGRGTVLRRYKLQPNSDPTSLSVTPNGLYVLVNEYQANALPDGYAIDWVWVYNGHSLRFVAQYQDSNSDVRSASW